jgi:surfeit locus 1 family protein
MPVTRSGQPASRWLFLSISVVTALVCVRLGYWQLERLATRRAANALARAALQVRPTLLPGPQSPVTGTRIQATGSFDLEHQFVLRGRAHDGAPGVEIVTPFRIEGTDSALLVVRGFVPSDNATSVDLSSLREAGPRTIAGVGFAMASDPDSGGPATRAGATTWRRLDLAAVRGRLPYPAYGVAIWQTKESGMSGMPIRTGAPELTEGPHLNYALQWFAFALIFGGGGIFYTFRTRDEKRETRDAL